MYSAIVAAIKKYKLTAVTESELQEQLAAVLTKEKIEFVREYRADNRNRFDFYCNGTAIELKVKGSPLSIFRQIERYAKLDCVSCIILFSRVPMGIPSMINGKPAFLISVGEGLL